MNTKILKSVLNAKKTNSMFSFQKRFIAQGATYQKNSNDVKLRGKFLKSYRPDMPTLVFFQK